MSTVHIGSTLSNPYKLNEEELREALIRANDDLLRNAIELAELKGYANQLQRFALNLCEAHAAGRSSDILESVRRLAEFHDRKKAELSAQKVH